MYVQNEEAKMSWEKVFSSAVLQSTLGTKEAAVKVVLGDVLKAAVTLLQSQSWTMRSQAVSVLKDVLSFIPSGLIAPNTAEVMTALLRTIPGQMWRGKGDLLRVVASLLDKCPQCLDAEMLPGDLFRVSPVSFGHSSKNSQAHDMLLLVQLGDMESRARLAEQISIRIAEYNKSRQQQHHTESELLVDDNVLANFPQCSGWRLSWVGIVSVLLQETARSDRQYRLAAASSLCTLPWSSMKSVAAIRSVLPLLPEVLDRAGLPCAATGIEKVQDNGSSEEKPSDTIAEERTVVRKTNYDMFGGRYGAASASTKGKSSKRARVSRVEEGLASVAVDAVAQIEDVVVEDAREGGDDASLLVVDEAVSLVESDAVMLESVDGECDRPFLAPTSDAAFRVKFLETAASMWPPFEQYSIVRQAAIKETDAVPYISNMINIPRVVLAWAILVARHEVWSVRKNVILLVQSIVAAAWPLSSADLSDTLQIIAMALDDHKYSQVRAAGATTLLKLLSVKDSQNMRPLIHDMCEKDIELKSKVGTLISVMSLDSNPSVISVRSQIQKLWNDA
jgi:hypothetical protein